MIKIENTEVFGWEAAVRGLRNPMNSWNKSDSGYAKYDEEYVYDWFTIGPNDLALMKRLNKAGNDHSKFLRMLNVTADITAPLYWWKEYDTYKIGTVANSCSTMHKIASKEFTFDDFSHEHLMANCDNYEAQIFAESSMELLSRTVTTLNIYRDMYLSTKDKKYWWQMIQLLPSSYNQRRTVQLNYQVLKSMYPDRHVHKLDEWREFCAWAESLPYFKEIVLD